MQGGGQCRDFVCVQSITMLHCGNHFMAMNTCLINIKTEGASLNTGSYYSQEILAIKDFYVKEFDGYRQEKLLDSVAVIGI